jgi:nucleoside-diphosphate-sugar epimerase
MNLLITGANGFIGQALVRRLLAADTPRITRLILLDLHGGEHSDPRVTAIAGDIADPHVLDSAFAESIDTVFHLASIPGGMAERDYPLGWRVNVDATAALAHRAGAQSNTPTFVFASSIAALGAPLPALVDDATPLCPGMSYGAQKQIGEILLQDLSRRGLIDARSVRLPGIVMRPPARTGQLSAFMSDLIRETAAGRAYTCPVSAQATLWLMSVERVIDNLLHAAHMPAPAAVRAWTLPALHLSIAELIEAIGRHSGLDAAALVSFRPDPALQQAFGNYPPLATPAADALGFRHDGDAVALVQRALTAELEIDQHA